MYDDVKYKIVFSISFIVIGVGSSWKNFSPNSIVNRNE